MALMGPGFMYCLCTQILWFGILHMDHLFFIPSCTFQQKLAGASQFPSFSTETDKESSNDWPTQEI